ncbi:hypothetical protein BH10PSE19_BH10PSE19_05260 [soil metagenome]
MLDAAPRISPQILLTKAKQLLSLFDANTDALTGECSLRVERYSSAERERISKAYLMIGRRSLVSGSRMTLPESHIEEKHSDMLTVKIRSLTYAALQQTQSLYKYDQKEIDRAHIQGETDFMAVFIQQLIPVDKISKKVTWHPNTLKLLAQRPRFKDLLCDAVLAEAKTIAETDPKKAIAFCAMATNDSVVSQIFYTKRGVDTPKAHVGCLGKINNWAAAETRRLAAASMAPVAYVGRQMHRGEAAVPVESKIQAEAEGVELGAVATSRTSTPTPA